MKTYTYDGTAYRQALRPEAPWLVSFVAPAEELLEWAGIPRRSEANQAGFQRLDDSDRIQRAKEFFGQPMNQSPTALMVGLRTGTDGTPTAYLEFTTDSELNVRPCRVVVKYEPMSIDQARELVRAQLTSRISESAKQAEHFDNDESCDAIEIETKPEQIGEIPDGFLEFEEDDELSTVDLDDPSDGEDELEMGHSVLKELLEKLDDEKWISVSENAKAVHDLAKPGTIIDGQHRVLGADGCERGIPFTVVALADCPWSEQVFQFTVVNYTAKGIPDQFITANAALSLTASELESLKVRLMQARVKVIEYDIMRVVNFDNRSPFFNLINITDRAQHNTIGYKTMIQTAKLWFNAKHEVFSMILPQIYPEIKGKGEKSKRIQQWKDEDWGDFFIAFWQCIKSEFDQHQGHTTNGTLWTVGDSQLMLAVVLLELQKSFLENLNNQDEDFFDVGESADRKSAMLRKIQIRAQKFAKFFPPEFFATEWKTSSLNTGLGRKELAACLEMHVKKKGKYQWRDSRLITGNVGD